MHPITLMIPGTGGYIEPFVEPKTCTYMTWLARLFMYGFIAAIVYGHIQFDGSYTWAPSINYHALGMALSGACCGEIMLASTSPCSKSVTTYITFGSHIMGIILGAGGMVAIIYSTSTHLYSIHSWTGIIFCGSWVSHGLSRLCLTGYTRLHAFLGKVTYVSGITACLLGLQEQQTQRNQSETSFGISTSTYSCITSVLLVVSSLATFAALSFM